MNGNMNGNTLRLRLGVFLTSQVGYRAKLHELPFMRISPNTTRRSRVVFGLIRVNGNECNFAQILHEIAKCSQGYLFLIPRIKVLKSAQNTSKVKIKILSTYCIRALLNHFHQGISIVNHKLGLSTYLYPALHFWVSPCVGMFVVIHYYSNSDNYLKLHRCLIYM